MKYIGRGLIILSVFLLVCVGLIGAVSAAVVIEPKMTGGCGVINTPCDVSIALSSDVSVGSITLVVYNDTSVPYTMEIKEATGAHLDAVYYDDVANAYRCILDVNSPYVGTSIPILTVCITPLSGVGISIPINIFAEQVISADLIPVNRENVSKSAELPIAINLNNGWNVVSIPKKFSASYDTAAELFADVDTDGHAVLTYNALTKSWEQVTASTKIEPLNAYWIYSTSAKSLSYEFSSTISTPAMKVVYKGWNAVGLSADKPLAASVAFGITNWHIYLEWNAATQKYNTPIVKGESGIYADTNLVSLWTGGWLYVNEDGTYIGFTS